MMNTDLIRTQTGGALTAADGRSWIQLALNWRVVDPVPDRLGESIDDLEVALRQGLNPCPISAYVVLLDKLFVATERPRDETVSLWRAQLDAFPEGVLRRAVEHVIGHHKWSGAPKVAQLVEAADTDSEWQDMKMVKLRMRTLKAAYASQQAAKVPDVPYNPAIADTVRAAARASQRHRVKRIDAEQEQRKAERKAKYKMSPAEEAKANKKALNTKTMKAAIAREGAKI